MNTDIQTGLEELSPLTEAIIGCAFEVSNALGSGFLEKVYENAMVVAIRRKGLAVRQQAGVDVVYEAVVVGHYVADLIAEEKVIVEVKAVTGIDDVHRAQCINYLKATGLRVCLLLNFGTPKVQIKRLVF